MCSDTHGRDGTTTERHTPVAVTGLVEVVQVAMGTAHTCAVLKTGAMKCWGNGAWGDVNTTERHTPMLVHRPTGVVQAVVGQNHMCAVLHTGATQCWGSNWLGELGDGTSNGKHHKLAKVKGLTGVAQIVAAG